MLATTKRFHFEIVGEEDPGTLLAALGPSEGSQT
jgi:hypothetical protein